MIYHRCNISVYLFFVIVLLNSVLAGQAAGVTALDMFQDELTPLEQSFFEDLSDGVLQGFDCYDAFLIASDIVHPPDFFAYRQQLRRTRNQVMAGLDKASDPYVLAERLLLRLHEQVFKEYVETAGSAGVLLDEGRYNCLLATILYCLLARDLGLTVSGVLVPGHTFCVLSDTREDKIIETTVRYGFDPGRMEVERMKQMIRYVYVPEASYEIKKTVSWRELLSLLYTNNLDLADFVVETDYADYLPRFKKALLFDPDNDVFEKNLIVCLNNLAVLSLEANRLEKAICFIRQGKRLPIQTDVFEKLERQYYNQAAARKADLSDFNGAVQLIREGLRRYPENSVLINNLLYFYKLWAESFVRRNDHAAAANIFAVALVSFPGNQEIRENLRIAYYNQAAGSFNSQEYKKAVSICREALSVFADDASFLDMMRAAQSMINRPNRRLKPRIND